MNAIRHQVAQTLNKIGPRRQRGLPRIMRLGVIIEEMRAAGRSYAEIGQAIGLSAATAKTYGARYRKQLRSPSWAKSS